MTARGLATTFAACLMMLNGPLAAQDTVRVSRTQFEGSRSAVARHAVDFFNAPRTTRVFGQLTIGRDDVVSGNVAVLDGPVRVAGLIEGDLVIINGALELADGCDVRGDVLVLGGTLARAARAVVDGTIRHHRAGIRVRRVGDSLELLDDRPASPPWTRTSRWRRRTSTARASVVVSTAGTYNRVEGLPILGGLRIRWRGFVGGQLQALGVFRTAGDFNSNRRDLGYAAEAFVRVGRDGNAPQVRVGARAADLVVPVEDWQLEADEIGLAALFLHRDYRDYYLRRSVTGFVTITPTDGLTLSGEVSRDEESSIDARDPWTLFRSDDTWRENPRVDEGHFTRLRTRLAWDSRDGRSAWRSGFYLLAEWEHGIADDSLLPLALPPIVRGPLPADYSYHRVFVDLRRYERIGWSGQLRLRAVGAGVVGDNPLPAQRRLSLGGPEPLPGYAFREFACNEALMDPAAPALCDRLVLFQVEYRGDLLFGLLDGVWNRSMPERSRDADLHGAWNWGDWWFDGPNIVLFADAGTAWLRGQDRGDLKVDLGAGLTFGSWGIYAAKALDGDESLRLLLRIHHRF